jgi:hypothetical protein
LTKRQPHFEASAALLRLCGTRITGLVAASQTTDIFYMLRRSGLDAVAAKAAVQKLAENVSVIDVTADNVRNALASDMPDYEDALLAFGGRRHKADCIATRDEKGFRQSPVPAMSPQALLERFL